MTTEWDAETYDRVADPMTRWGAQVLDRLELRGDEHVLDAGCGSGRVTELLLDRLPRGSVIAMDASSNMIEQARLRLEPQGDRVTYVVGDLLSPIPASEIDAVLSTATFHWILDHDTLFENIAAVLRSGGLLAAQCGGAGNVANVLDAVREVLGTDDADQHAYFATPEETAERLRSVGFVDVRCWLHDEPTAIERGAPLETYLRTVCVRTWADRMGADERDAFVAAVAERLPNGVVDYVRLNIDARAG